MRNTLFLFAMAAFTAFGADITGKWSGKLLLTINGEPRDTGAYLILNQDGTKVTGSVGQRADRQIPIKIGTVEENRIKLEVALPEGPQSLFFDLKADGDRITGELKGSSDSDTVTGKLDLTREKEPTPAR